MRSTLLPLLALPLIGLSCSDYDLAADNDPTRLSPKHGDSFDPNTDDTSQSADSGRDSGEVVDPGTEVPEGKVDVVLLIDIAYFYDCYHADLALNTAALIDALFASGANVAVGIAKFDDYYVDDEWYTAWGGEPYTFGTQITTDRGRLSSVASSLELEWGGDGPGDGYEAIRQAGNGIGYDQDCDGKLDATYDISPFIKSGGDAFGGKVASLYDVGVAGSGTEGGMGFRPDSKRVVVLITENALRESSYGHEMPKGSCPAGATRSDAVTAITDIDAKFLGVNAYEFWDEDPTPQEQLEALATRTDSKFDKDGDGKKDDLAVFGQSWDWPTTAELVDAIWQLAG
ncbi:hypothetical protein LBMAG42_04190 [Deltaproteobacteria bacterium]|nr:hypothetical protein LBMAG42_04190 [Deltaproteobacteria bacterium]